MHGGTSKGPSHPNASQNARTHGFYSSVLTDTEVSDAAMLEIGKMEELIRLAHIQLRRIMLAKNAALNNPELEEVTESNGTVSRKSRVIDYDAKIDRALARIGYLELQRKTLMESTGTADLNVHITGGF